MFRWSVVVGAVVVYLTVLGCVMFPADAPAGQESVATPARRAAVTAPVIRSRQGLPVCAVSMQIQRTDWIDKYKNNMDEIAALGADGVLLVIDTRVENTESARIWLDTRYTPTPDQLGDLIRHAKSLKLRVIMMPVVLLDRPRGNEWRGKIAPSEDNGGWAEWFKSYKDMMTHFAWISEANGVDVLVVGSELISAEKHIDEWTEIIQHVRGIYKGRLTYSSNWDHYHAVHFWDQLDLIGMNSYWKFADSAEDRPSVEDIVQRWDEIKQDLLEFVQQEKKPLLFTEIGWFSQENVAYEPWDYTQDRPIDLDLQKRLYEGFFKSWWGNPHLGGFSVWEWPTVDGGPKDGGYTPKGKPAEAVLREWLAKPRWDVR